MEDPDRLLARILDFAIRNDGIDAVIQTGSRARGRGVDEFSDLDIEFIGPRSANLAGRDDWLNEFGDQLVSIHLANDEDDAPPHWPTCLVVFAEGRKVDFTLAGRDRIDDMERDGLDELYRRGYVVLYDKDGITRGLQPSNPCAPVVVAPPQDEFVTNQREFWFEATQVPVYVVRGDLWPAQLRLAEMRDLLLGMLTWNARTVSMEVDTWHNGHHLAEWLPREYQAQVSATFAQFDVRDILRALRGLIDLYAAVASESAARLALPDIGLRDRVVRHIIDIEPG